MFDSGKVFIVPESKLKTVSSRVYIPRFGLYVSTHGVVYDSDYIPIPIQVSTKGYQYIEFKYLNQNGNYSHTRKMIHKLVAEAFLGNKPPKHEINHKDGNKSNNHASNLEYVTHKENIRHALDILKADFRRHSVR